MSAGSFNSPLSASVTKSGEGGASGAQSGTARPSRHELRTPVHHILGCSELLLEEAEDAGLADAVPALQTIHTAGKRVLELVDQLAAPSGPDDTGTALARTLDALRTLLDEIRGHYAIVQAQAGALGKPDILADLRPIDAAARQLLALIDGPGVGSGEGPEPDPVRAAAEAPREATPEGRTASATAPANALAPSSAQTDRGSLLIVDDNTVNRETLARRLERLGYTTFLAENGRQALDVLNTASVDLVLCDILMPEMDGYEVLERRRADARLRDVPFIMLSALDDLDSVVRCIEMGAEDYLPKPFEPVLLRARIGACLEKKRLRDQEKEYQAALGELNRTLEARVQEQVEELERVGRLRRFLSPQLAEAIVSSGDERLLESHRREITVVFTDLRGFTAFAGTAEPEDVMGVLREYHAAMGELIFRYEGTLEHFAGDGLMVFFNDPIPCPDPTVRAVRMALAMRERAGELAQAWRRRGHRLGFGVGIAQGYATLGKIGFEGRFDYGAIGTVTNLASRLCDEAQPDQILISGRAYTAVEDLVDVESLDDLSLKGFGTPVPAFNVIGVRAP